MVLVLAEVLAAGLAGMPVDADRDSDCVSRGESALLPVSVNCVLLLGLGRRPRPAPWKVPSPGPVPVPVPVPVPRRVEEVEARALRGGSLAEPGMNTSSPLTIISEWPLLRRLEPAAV